MFTEMLRLKLPAERPEAGHQTYSRHAGQMILYFTQCLLEHHSGRTAASVNWLLAARLVVDDLDDRRAWPGPARDDPLTPCPSGECRLPSSVRDSSLRSVAAAIALAEHG